MTTYLLALLGLALAANNSTSADGENLVCNSWVLAPQ
jgi:hypothetical protein